MGCIEVPAFRFDLVHIFKYILVSSSCPTETDFQQMIQAALEHGLKKRIDAGKVLNGRHLLQALMAVNMALDQAD